MNIYEEKLPDLNNFMPTIINRLRAVFFALRFQVNNEAGLSGPVFCLWRVGNRVGKNRFPKNKGATLLT